MVYFEKWGELKRNEVQEIQLNKKLTHSISKIKGLFKNDKRNTNAE
jgi:hypothetical protein